MDMTGEGWGWLPLMAGLFTSVVKSGRAIGTQPRSGEQKAAAANRRPDHRQFRWLMPMVHLWCNPTPVPMSTMTAPARTYFSDLHNDQREWLNALAFYKEDITILEHRLEDIVRRNNKAEVLAQVEHFQNRFIREREVIDVLRHDIKQEENMLEKEMKDNPVAIEHRYFKDHTELRDRYQTFEKLYRELKQEFQQWLVKWM